MNLPVYSYGQVAELIRTELHNNKFFMILCNFQVYQYKVGLVLVEVKIVNTVKVPHEIPPDFIITRATGNIYDGFFFFLNSL